MRKILFLLAMFVATLAMAERTFPGTSKRGDLNSAEFPYVQIGKDVIKLAPGAKIYDDKNQLVMPTRLPQKAPIRYSIEASTGLVLNIWLLSPEEAAQK
jgi:hypothetical protein